MTGTVGFRPTTGCWDAGDGIVPMTVSRDTVGTCPPYMRAQPVVARCAPHRPSIMEADIDMGCAACAAWTLRTGSRE